MKRLFAAGGVVAALTVLVVMGRGEPTAQAAEAGKPSIPAKIKFNRDVRPILSTNCYACHGPDEHDRKRGLRLDERDAAVAQLKVSGKAAIVPGDPDASELIARINHPDPDKRMPHKSSNKTLTEEQKLILRRWIEQGAEYEGHWSFLAPTRPQTPRVAHDKWVRNPIDAFIAARLELEGLEPSSEAAKHVLIRRVTFDLTGLPPTPAEVQAFVHDDSPQAYEKLVDRLLASPAYGEHMARFWLDAARYGDTHGLHLDNYREMWPYRDAVVAAFNDNMRWDRFTLASIAGDLLPDKSQRDEILSGFLRCHITTNEGGSITEEVYVRNVTDRTSTVGTVFLGLTAGCAVCHDHKFDPLTQKDYFSMWAYFNNLDAPAMDQNAAAFGPIVKVPTPDQESELAAHEKTLAEAEAAVAEMLKTVVYAEPDLPERERKQYVWIDDEAPAAANVIVAEPHNLAWNWVAKADHPVTANERSLRLEADGLKQYVFQGVGKPLKVGAGDKLFTYVFIDPANPPKEIMLQWHTDGWKHRAYWGENAIPWGADNTTQRQRMGDLPKAGEWVRLEVPTAAVGINPGDVIVGWAFTQQDGVAYWDQSGIDSAVAQEPEDFVWIDDETPEGAKKAGNWQWVTADDGKHPVHSGQRSLRHEGAGLSQDYFTGATPLMIKPGDRLFTYVYLDPKNPPSSVQLQFNNGTWEHRARWGGPAHGPGRANGADFVASEKAPEPGKWVRLEVAIEDVGLKPGDAINGWAFTPVDGITYWDTAGVKTYDAPDDRHLQSLAIWAERAKFDDNLPADVKQAAVGAPDGRTPAQEKRLRDYYVQWVWAGSRNDFDPINARIEAARKGMDAIRNSTATTLVMKERATVKEAFVLTRGEYDQKGAKVDRATPGFLPPMPEGSPNDRLGFAQWLIAAEHPLMARVTVNRFWQQCFGTGLVKTSEDLGSQGEYPSHPELLDWLAVDFRESGWDIKRLMKQIVMSSTYRQTSKATDELIGRDPTNRLLARGPRFRMDAEMVRDQALAVSGLLVMKMGGPSVKPPQPIGLWNAVGYSGSNTANFKADSGPDRVHRRTLYTFLKRTAPAPQLDIMNAPNRESCTVRRERTNTPLQALMLMNDPQYVEAARALGQRAIKEGGDSPASRVDLMYTLCLGRKATDTERAAIVDAYQDHLSTFKAEPDEAKKLIAVGESKPDASIDPAELAAWTMTANLVLNLDEVLNKN